MVQFQLMVEVWLATVANWAALLPLGYATGAGMVSAVNPCGFALLPAYLGLYLGEREEAPLLLRLLRAFLLSLLVTLGFLVLFGAIGGVIVAGGRFLVSFFPWLGLVVGVALLPLGVHRLLGGHWGVALPARAASHIGGVGRRGLGPYFLFGLTFGLASLSCTLPIFLVVVAGALVGGGLLASLSGFLGYGVGMGLAFTILTLSFALVKGSLKGVRRALPWIERGSGLLMALAGAYLILYWLFIGGLLSRFT